VGIAPASLSEALDASLGLGPPEESVADGTASLLNALEEPSESPPSSLPETPVDIDPGAESVAEGMVSEPETDGISVGPLSRPLAEAEGKSVGPLSRPEAEGSSVGPLSGIEAEGTSGLGSHVCG